jgi:predicted enzyme related to lactoylglutathione lyase
VAELRVDGGACVNDLLMQFQADLLGIPVVRPQVIETTALDAAYLAGLSCGLYRSRARAFYQELLGLDPLMDFGWIHTYGSQARQARQAIQVSFATEGGFDTPVPDTSIEVDDLDAALARVGLAGIPIEYGPAEEPWGVRRFYVRDPFGKLVNIFSHA